MSYTECVAEPYYKQHWIEIEPERVAAYDIPLYDLHAQLWDELQVAGVEAAAGEAEVARHDTSHLLDIRLRCLDFGLIF